MTSDQQAAVRGGGAPIRLGANEPLQLVEATHAWQVEQGVVDVFAVAPTSEPDVPRLHLAAHGPGDVLFGTDKTTGFRLIAVGTSESVVIPLAESEKRVEDRAQWLRALADGLGTAESAGAAADEAVEPVDALSDAISLSRSHTERSDAERTTRQLQGRESALSAGLDALAGLLGSPAVLASSRGREGDLVSAFRTVAAAQGIRIPPQLPPHDADDVSDLARACGVRSRRVALDADWWRSDGGAFVAYRTDGHRAVALIPVGGSRYRLVDASDGTRRLVDAEAAAGLEPHAFALFRPLPDRPVRLAELVAYAFGETRVDLIRLVLFSAASALVALAVPVATGQLIGVVIPQSNRSLLLQLTLALVVAAIAAAFFQLATSIALLRIRGRLDRSLWPAIWGRILALPTAFFTRYSAGELASRVLSLDSGLQLISGGTAATMLGGVFSVFSFALIWFYSVALGIVAAILLLAQAAAVIVIGRVLERRQRTVEAAGGELSGLTRELVSGIGKLKTSGAAEHAFQAYAAAFSRKRSLRDSVRSGENLLVVISGVFPLVSSMVLFAAAGIGVPPSVSPEAFLAVNAAYGQVSFALLAMSQSAILVVRALPGLRRMGPVFAEPTEDAGAGIDPGRLRGDIEFSGISFRYHSDGPLVLDNVSIRVDAGSSIALVGPSGSGKSTLGRLLLGFEKPDDGTVFFDDQDLSALDVRAVRRQLGVVLQSADVLPGTILSNIAGSAVDVSLQDAWRAAEHAGLADDIRAMPMGMYTTITEGGSTISGGQRQRLLIARALAGEPRILLFDEATSALDNRTQAVVGRSLAAVSATRIIIAHRLSTVVDADCIYYLESGRVIESGTYRQLMERGGAFAGQARRQLS